MKGSHTCQLNTDELMLRYWSAIVLLLFLLLLLLRCASWARHNAKLSICGCKWAASEQRLSRRLWHVNILTTARLYCLVNWSFSWFKYIWFFFSPLQLFQLLKRGGESAFFALPKQRKSCNVRTNFDAFLDIFFRLVFVFETSDRR